MSGRGTTILLVDDEACQRDQLGRALRAAGYGLVMAADYDTAVAAFQQHSGEIAMIVTDIALPGRNGYELALALQAVQPELIAVFTSAEVGAELNRFYGMTLPDDHFLPKPLRPAQLVRRVRILLERAKPASGEASAR